MRFRRAWLCLVPCFFAGAAAADDVVLLPPLLVTERRSDGPAWRYAAAGGVEVLSACDDRVTTDFFRSYLKRKLELDLVLPPRLRLDQAMPTALILITPALARTMNEQLVAAMRAKAAGGQGSGYITPAGAEINIYRVVRMMPQMMLSDADSTGAVFDLGDQDSTAAGPDPADRRFFPGGLAGGYSGLNFTAGRIASLVGDRTPPLPEWFRSGFMAFYGTIDWEATARDFHDIFSLRAPGVFAPPLIWISARDSRALRHGPDAEHPFLNVPELFAPAGDETSSPAQDAVRNAEIALLFHWAYLDPTHARRDALWRFADRASREPVTDVLIHECFGLDPTTLTLALKGFLPEALKQPVHLLSENAAAASPLRLRAASELEITRIKGEMGLREAVYVKAQFPDEISAYAEGAEAGLRGLYAAGERDPSLQAAYGLFEHFRERDEAARPLLEAAAAARVARPAVYAVLAQLRFKAALDHPEGPGGLLSAAQTRSVLDLVQQARRHAPPQRQAYVAAIDAWAHSAPPLDLGEFYLLDEGVRDFPGDLDLVEGAAKLCAQNGMLAQGQRLIDWAIACQPSGSFHRTSLADFRAELAQP